MSYTFTEAEPVKVEGTGKPKADNPFTEAVAGIAGKVNGDKPAALAFVEEHDTENEKTILNRIRRFLSEAGRGLETPVTVRMNIVQITDGTEAHEVDGVKIKRPKVTGSKITFWTVPLQSRPRTASAAPVQADNVVESK